MAQTNPTSSSTDQRAFSYLVGIGVTHSIAPPMHDHIAAQLGYNWKFKAQECATVEEAVQLFRLPSFAGGVVTMPYKQTIMKHLDGLDEHALKIGACNNVYRSPKDGSLRGTNTDWRGIQGCLLDVTSVGKGRAALIIGAGGAARAAVYALHDQLGCNPIYVVNRDGREVEALVQDARKSGSSADVVHIKTVLQAKSLQAPYYIVGSVPDFEPQSSTEMEARNIIEWFLSNASDKGVLLDMCFKPRRTRTLKLGEKYRWRTVEGTGIIGHQIEEQYRLWCGEDASRRIDKAGAWQALKKAADESTFINF